MNQDTQQKKSFLLYNDSLDILDHLSDEQSGSLFKAIKSYINGDETKLEPILKIAFIPIKNQIDRDLEKYASICERNRINGLKGGRPPKPKEPSGLSGNPKNPDEPKKAHTDTDTDTDTDTKEKKKVPKKKALSNFISEQTWKDVKSHRAKIKKPMSERAEKIMIANLKSINDAGIDVESAVDMMVDKGWSSICVEWFNNAKSNGNKAEHSKCDLGMRA